MSNVTRAVVVLVWTNGLYFCYFFLQDAKQACYEAIGTYQFEKTDSETVTVPQISSRCFEYLSAKGARNMHVYEWKEHILWLFPKV